MTFLLVTLLFAQYADVYVPHKPLDVESGALLVTGSFKLDVVYRSSSVNPDFSSPVLSSLTHSPDGYNEIGIGLPWLRVAGDSANHVFIGNMEAYYKRRILGSLRWGYLAAKLEARLPTSPDTLGIRDSLGGRSSHYSLVLAYTYELSLLAQYNDLFGRLPLVATVALEDWFLDWDHDAGQGKFGTSFGWGAALEVLPLDYAFIGASITGGNDDFSFGPYLGFRWRWFDLGAAWRMSDGSDRLDFHLRLYL
jgi:hypothetical protein